jgi:arabinoxylan arabinofuranohydrolase
MIPLVLNTLILFRPLLFTALMLLASLPSLRADYPIASHRYLADPSVLVTKERVYAYCSNDDLSKVEGSYNIPNVVCISSSDMKNWTDHGVVFEATRDTSWAKKTWAPAAAERDGKVFLYFGNGGSTIGVAVGDTPTGPFLDVLKGPLITHDTPGVKPAEKMWLFDPAVFIDDDGQAYIYFGGNGDDNARVAKLKRDMVSLDGDVMRMHVPNFFEASWMHKRNGVYYFSYSTQPKAEMRIDYLTSKNPVSGFEYRGIVATQPPINNNNNHACEFEFKGKWYHIYHNRNVAKKAGIPTGFRRNIALETFDYNTDGSIKTVVYTTDGPQQIAPVNPYERFEGETFSDQQGVETEPCNAGGMYLTAIENKDWIKVSGVDFGAKGPSHFNADVASDSQGGTIELRLGSPEGRLIGSCKVPNTGGWQNWQSLTCDVAKTTGSQDLFLVFVGGEGQLLNLNFWKFD